MKDQIDWQKVDNLIPCVVQDYQGKDVLMLGYMNPEALEKTLASKLVTFYSRSKQRLWTKGESSGNVLNLIDIKLDCDNDTLLVSVRPEGPTCHKGSKTCFGEGQKDGFSFLQDLESTIDDRFSNPSEGSYIASLIHKGIHKMAQKVGEEGVEVALAAKDDDRDEFLGESADLMFHLMVLLRAKGCSLQDAVKVLESRS